MQFGTLAPFFTAVTFVVAGTIECPKCKCGLIGPVYGRHGRIVGGVEAAKGELPWLAGIVRDGQLVCGATLISSRHLITAAHCLKGFNASSITVLVGQHNVSEESSMFAHRVSHIAEHPQFNKFNFDNDIAVVRLASPLSQDLDMPVCLPDKIAQDAMAGQNALVAGWGSTEEKGPFSNIPMKAYVDIWSFDDCENAGYGSSKITPRMLCAASTETDSCRGDSGGPLVLSYPHTIVGVVSWGRGCARSDYPGVYTRVDQYLPWLRLQMKGQCFCSSRQF